MGIASRDMRPVPLIGPPSENVEDAQVDRWASTIIDGLPIIVEDKLHLLKRPGLVPFVDLGTHLPIDGLYWWDRQRVVLAVSAGRVWKIIDSAGTRQEITGSSELRASQLVSFANDGSTCVMANGGRMVHTDLSTLTTMADAGAPTNVTHVAYVDGTMVANEVGSARAHFSEDDIFDWPALNIFTAEANPDDLVAIQEAYRELILLGRESVEFWRYDGQTPFSAISGSAQPFGTEAPDSLANVGGVWIWLDHKRRLVTMQGRVVVPVSSPYDRIIQRFTSVNDAVGFTTMIDGHPIYLLNFPTDRQTLAFNYATKVWHKWGYWDIERASYSRYRGQTYCYARSWNAHLVGDYSNGIIYKASRSYYTDNGNPIRTLLRTGHISHGAAGTKRSNLFRLLCKRGLANDAVADPKVMLRYRTDNGARWSNERWASLGRTGDHLNHIDWRRNGIYRTRQYELIHSDPSDFVVMGAQEDVELLGR